MSKNNKFSLSHQTALGLLYVTFSLIPHFVLAHEWDAEKNSGPTKTGVKAEATSTAVETADQWDAKFQSTYIWQTKPSFPALYSGPNSLSPHHEKSYSFTATAFLGVRLWESGELYFNPELVQGVPMSNLTGLGGLSNSELQKTAEAKPKLYSARLFLRQTWGMGKDGESVYADNNQLAGNRSRNRLVITAGNLAVSDIFDGSSFAHDARTQFLNWSLLTHGAYDFAADARGYSWGGAIEYIDDDWALRAGRFLQPREANGLKLDWHFFVHYGDQIEAERSYLWRSMPGKIRLLVFRNVVVAGAFRDAIALANTTNEVPDVTLVRKRQTKHGIGINWEQSLTSDIGLFVRAAASNGAIEVYAFAEIDRSLSTAITAKGTAWGRGKDVWGIALARNELSVAHRDYLAAGGLGFFVGDGRIRYRPEQIIETYYNINIRKGSSIGLGYQRITNPAYNADRGPVSVTSIRLHTEF